MGNIISSPMHKAPHPAERDGPRPAKRRRLSSPDSFDIDRLIVSPPLFESGSTLRIEVLKILHKNSKKVKSYQGSTFPRDVLTSKARCRVTIYDLSSGAPQILHCQSQLCNLVTFKNPVGPHRLARVDLSHPFYVPQESILINRPDDGRFDLSDSYQLLVELEAANEVSWPPLDSHDLGISVVPAYPPCGLTQHWILSSRFDGVVGRLKHCVSLSARFPADQPTFQTDYVMDVDLRWAAGFKSLGHLDKDSKPCITAIDPDADHYGDADVEHPRDSEADGSHDRVNGESSHDPDDDFLNDQTPSRSLRTREKAKVYNLKVLSDQAQGRDQKRRGRSIGATAVDGRIQYLLPSDQPVCLDFFRCVSCGAYHESMVQLQLHLQSIHPTYEYVLESTGQGPQFRVSTLREPIASPNKANQLGRQVKPFTLRTIATADQTWVTSRFVLESDEASRLSPSQSHAERLQSDSPILKGSRLGVSRRSRRPKASKALVPEISQPLFHPISRARLQPGQEVPETLPDETWLIQKHRESIGDFSDVTPAEKEYIWEWDGYILQKNLTSVAYFHREWLGFVKEKARWLASEERRMLEFGKHSSVLLARDVLDDKIIGDAFVFIDDARAELRRVGVDLSGGSSNRRAAEAALKQSPRTSQIRKSANGCTVCKLPVLGPTLLICSNALSTNLFEF
ncbi:hypothetical protein CDD83_2165 [Cordyceps sp. RAO-2017]|nr:hypothetical protein CDD83_2165 [Cordyceps sp. RAO-2017]